MNSHRHFSHLVGALALAGLAGLATACGGSSPSTPASSSTPPSTSAPPSSAPATSASTSATSSIGGAATVNAITTNWEAFFNAKTPIPKRVSLLENGSQFQSVIQAQAGSGLAALATAKVTNVTVNSPTQATVKYNILVSGTPELTNQTGVAVNQNGTWKVGVASFCGLLIIENAGKTSGLPAACKSAA
jgi:hypothetical protein